MCELSSLPVCNYHDGAVDDPEILRALGLGIAQAIVLHELTNLVSYFGKVFL